MPGYCLANAVVDLMDGDVLKGDGLIETEARRIVGKMKELSDSNSPDKSHFMVELSPYFTQIATTKDTDRLFSMLP